jgi:hypothetical protein
MSVGALLFFGGSGCASPGLDVAGSRLPVGFASGAADLRGRRMLFIFLATLGKRLYAGWF